MAESLNQFPDTNIGTGPERRVERPAGGAAIEQVDSGVDDFLGPAGQTAAARLIVATEAAADVALAVRGYNPQKPDNGP